LGCKIKVPTVHGEKSLKIPAGTQSGTRFSLRHEGVKALRSGELGDMVVVVDVHVPEHLSSRQRELLEEFAELEKSNGAANHDGLFTKLFRKSA
jgi:molecular chaperone DnaJ